MSNLKEMEMKNSSDSEYLFQPVEDQIQLDEDWGDVNLREIHDFGYGELPYSIHPSEDLKEMDEQIDQQIDENLISLVAINSQSSELEERKDSNRTSTDPIHEKDSDPMTHPDSSSLPDQKARIPGKKKISKQEVSHRKKVRKHNTKRKGKVAKN